LIYGVCLLHIIEKSKKEGKSMVFGPDGKQKEEKELFSEEKEKKERSL